VLKALQNSTTRFWDFVLERADGLSSVAVALSLEAELLEGHIDAAATNGVRWGTQSMLAATLSHFSDLGTELKMHGSKHNIDLTEDQVDAHWT
jgi:hypothetical protein